MRGWGFIAIVASEWTEVWPRPATAAPRRPTRSFFFFFGELRRGDNFLLVHFLFEVHPGFPLPVGSLPVGSLPFGPLPCHSLPVSPNSCLPNFLLVHDLFPLSHFLLVHFFSTSCWFTSCQSNFLLVHFLSAPQNASCQFTSCQSTSFPPTSCQPSLPSREGGRSVVCVRHPPDQSETFWSTI